MTHMYSCVTIHATESIADQFHSRFVDRKVCRTFSSSSGEMVSSSSSSSSSLREFAVSRTLEREVDRDSTPGELVSLK